MQETEENLRMISIISKPSRLRDGKKLKTI